ncbi:unnamed protein product [Nesidiocoris tenuis]|uniref:Uncharacterized protein n=1 Tax=Nesidiocoris tenuis TaxID=355587 RepID=A0A6H5HPR6_9HEMI|nr:unnamed protein product [Nesidiocoris tenuis]
MKRIMLQKAAAARICPAYTKPRCTRLRVEEREGNGSNVDCPPRLFNRLAQLFVFLSSCPAKAVSHVRPFPIPRTVWTDRFFAPGQDEEGIKTRRELHVETRRGSRPDVSFMPERGSEYGVETFKESIKLNKCKIGSVELPQIGKNVKRRNRLREIRAKPMKKNFRIFRKNSFLMATKPNGRLSTRTLREKRRKIVAEIPFLVTFIPSSNYGALLQRNRWSLLAKKVISLRQPCCHESVAVTADLPPEVPCYQKTSSVKGSLDVTQKSNIFDQRNSPHHRVILSAKKALPCKSCPQDSPDHLAKGGPPPQPPTASRSYTTRATKSTCSPRTHFIAMASRSGQPWRKRGIQRADKREEGKNAGCRRPPTCRRCS